MSTMDTATPVSRNPFTWSDKDESTKGLDTLIICSATCRENFDVGSSEIMDWPWALEHNFQTSHSFLWISCSSCRTPMMSAYRSLYSSGALFRLATCTSQYSKHTKRLSLTLYSCLNRKEWHHLHLVCFHRSQYVLSCLIRSFYATGGKKAKYGCDLPVPKECVL